MKLPQHCFAILALMAFAVCSASQLYGQADAASETLSPATMEAFQKIENRWTKAINEHDQYDLEFLLAPEMLDISSAGQLTTRNQQIANILGKNSESLSVQARVGNVRVFGDVAIVIGTYIEQGRIKNKPLQHTGIFTHVYYRARNHWVCISAQQTAIAEPIESKGRGSKGSRNRGRPPAISLPLPNQGSGGRNDPLTGASSTSPHK